MTVVASMLDTPYGAMLPVVTRVTTTAEDDFEDCVEDSLRSSFPFPAFRVSIRRAAPLRKKKGKRVYLRPDFRVVMLTPEVREVLVADAKSGRTVRKRDVEDVVRYRKAFGSQTILYHPADAKVTKHARALANAAGVRLEPHPWQRR